MTSFPLAVSGFGAAATAVVLLLAGGLVAGMVLAIRAVADDSGKYSELKDFVEALMGTPKHLQPGRDEPAARREPQAEDTGGAREAFSEPCPGCGEPVTERHRECPSCGLRVQ